MDQLVVVLTGPESSGKSQICKDLSEALNIPWVPEYARSYLEEHGPEYDYEKLQTIYTGHLARQAKALKSAKNPAIILDTDTINFIVWSRRVFQKVPDFMYRQLKKEAHFRYLICQADLPWEADPLRENPDEREAIMREHQALIEDLERPYAMVFGQKKERLRNALDALSKISPPNSQLGA